MTDLKVLDELERLEKAATPKPWLGDLRNVEDILPAVFEDDALGSAIYIAGDPAKVRPQAQTIANIELGAALRNSADSLIADSRRLQKIEAAARALVDAMETCHICEGTLHLDEGPVHCENCSGDCEDHEGPECVPLYRLHWTLKRALKDCCDAGAVEPTAPSVEGRA